MLYIKPSDHLDSRPAVHPSQRQAHISPVSQKLHVACAISNPERYYSRYKHYQAFSKHMAESGVILHTAELALRDRHFEITEPNNPFHIQLRSESELWHKENLLNIAISHFSPDWHYGAYVDADFLLTRPDWATEAIHQLQHYGWVQLFSTYADLMPDFSPGQVWPSFASVLKDGGLIPDCPYRYDKGGLWGSPGGAWAFRREAFDGVGGLLDTCVLGCYDDETEVFSGRGWIPFSELTMEDKVFSLSPAKVAEWQPVNKLYRYKYDGYMRRFKSQSVDLLVTPNHNMVYENREGSLYFQKAEEFRSLNTNRAIPKSQSWIGVLPSKIPVDVSLEDWVAFVGLWIAEGWTYLATDKDNGAHHYRIGIAQKSGEKCRRIADLLDRFPISWHRNDRCFMGNHKGLFFYLRGLGKRSWEKCIPDEIKNLPTDLLNILLNWYMLGDGNVDHAKKDNHTDSLRMFTTSKLLRDDLLEVIIKTGRWGSYRVRQPRASKPLESGRVITARRVGYDIWIHRGRSFGVKSRHLTDVAYSGDVFCCETPYHTLLVRRNGKMIWCGNSADWHMAVSLAGSINKHADIRIGSEGYLRSIALWEDRAKNINGNIGYINNHALHFWHGKKRKRGYGSRTNILSDHNYDPYVDIKKDWQGVVGWCGNKPRLEEDVRKYFRDRDEDSTDV